MKKYRIYDWKVGGKGILLVEANDAEDACERAAAFLASPERVFPMKRKPEELGAFRVIEGETSW